MILAKLQQFFSKTPLFSKAPQLWALIPSILLILVLMVFIISYWVSSRQNRFVEMSGRVDLDFQVFYLENDIFPDNPVPRNLAFLMSFTDFIEVGSRFSAQFSEETEIHYNYSATKRVVIRYMSTTDGNLNPIVFEASYPLSESEGILTSRSINFPLRGGNGPGGTYTIFPKEHIDYYLEFVAAQALQMEEENIIARGMRGFSSELFIDFTYDIYVPDWDLRESVTLGYRLSLSSEVYSFIVTGDAAFGRVENLAAQPRQLTLPAAIVIVALFALGVYGVFSSIKKLQRDTDENRQEVADILKKYANEIVISKDSPLLSQYTLMRVSDFEELLKLAINLNRHIMCCYNDEQAEFALVIENYAYYYCIYFHGYSDSTEGAEELGQVDVQIEEQEYK